MKTNKNSVIGLAIFTLLFFVLYLIIDNEIFKSIVFSCFTGTIVGIISSYVLYLSDFKENLSNYLIKYSKFIKSIESIRGYKVEYIFKDYHQYINILENLYKKLDELIINNSNFEIIDYKTRNQLKLQQNILLDFRKLIDDNIYYLYSSDKASEECKKKILLDLIIKFQKFKTSLLNESIIKISKMYSCDDLIIETYFDTNKEYKSLELIISEIEESEKVLISAAINIDKKK